jgi:hypothetical protein
MPPAALAATADAFSRRSQRTAAFSSVPRRGDGVLMRHDRGLDEGIEFGFAGGRGRSGPRHELVARAIESDPLCRPGLPSRGVAAAMADHPFMAMHHHLVAHDARAAGTAAIAAADAAAVVDHLPTARGARARDLDPRCARSPSRPGRSARSDPADLGRRAAEAAFAAGRWGGPWPISTP